MPDTLTILSWILDAVLIGLALAIPLVVIQEPLNTAIVTASALAAEPVSRLRSRCAAAIATLGEMIEATRYALIRAVYEPNSPHPSWIGWAVFGVLVYGLAYWLLVLASAVVDLARLAAYFGADIGDIPISTTLIAITNGLMWVTTGSVYGWCALEALTSLSPLRVWHRLGDRARKTVGVVCCLGIVLWIGATIALWGWGQMALQGVASPELSWTFLVLAAALVGGALILSGWALLPFLSALWLMVLSIGRVVMRLGHLILTILHDGIEIGAGFIMAVIEIPAHVGRGLINFFRRRMDLPPLTKPALPEPVRADTATTTLSGAATGGTESLDDEEVPMPQPSTIVLGVGDARFEDQFIPALGSLGFIQKLRGRGRFTPHTSSRVVRPAWYGPDLSPTMAEIKDAAQHAQGQEAIEEHALLTMAQKTIDLRVIRGPQEGELISMAEPLTGTEATRAMFMELHRRLPLQRTLMLLREGDKLHQDGRREELVTLAADLKREDAVQAIIRLPADDLQEACAARALASVLAAHEQDPATNPAMGIVLQELGQGRTYTRIVSQSLAVSGRKPGGWSRRQLGADVADAVAQARHATDALMTEVTRRVLTEDMAAQPLVVVYTAPVARRRSWLQMLRRAERSPYEEFRNALSRWLADRHPNVTGIFCAGQGTPNPEHHASPYFVQTSLLFPLIETRVTGNQASEVSGADAVPTGNGAHAASEAVTT